MGNLGRILLLSVVLVLFNLASTGSAQQGNSGCAFNNITQRCESTWFGFSLGSRNFNYSGTGVTLGLINLFGENVHGRIDADYYSFGGGLEIGASLHTNMQTVLMANQPGSYTNTYIAAGPRGLFLDNGASTIGLGGLFGLEWRIQQIGTFLEIDATAPLLLVDPDDGTNSTSALFKVSLGMNLYF